jgi:hypothetical protein
MIGLIKLLGSVRFTVFISIALIILLIISTSMEAVNGTPFAQEVFYKTRWFDLVVSMLWVNIFCSTIMRFPFKRGQVGFLVTHIGILLLLAGALITRTHAVEGSLAVYEGETSDSVRQDGYNLAVAYPNQEQSKFELKEGNFSFALTKARLDSSKKFCPIKDKPSEDSKNATMGTDVVSFSVTALLQHATERMTVAQGNTNDPVNHAVQVKVQSKQLALNSLLWLMENGPGDSSSAEAMAGQVKFALRKSMKVKQAQSQKSLVRVFDTAGQEILVIDVEGGDIPKKIPLAKTGLSIKDLVYYPYATVAKNGLVNYPEGKRLNPAVAYMLVDGTGVETRQVKFAYFPDFETMHPSKGKKSSDVQIRFEAGEAPDAQDSFDGLQVTFYYGEKDVWQYQVKHQEALLKEGEVTIGKCMPSGWMDVEFCAQELLSRANLNFDVVPSKNEQDPMAVAVTVPAVSGQKVHWVFDNKPVPVLLSKGEVYFFLAPKELKLPFSVELKQFRKIDYPGTMDAAGYESDVVLTDASKGVSIERTISMNLPLQYEGYKIFQSSYMSDPEHGKGSVFTVAKNPGIPWIYIGSTLACIGALLLFYWTRKEESQ